MSNLTDSRGFALILVLLVLALLIVMVTEFSYEVFTSTSSLYNWYDGRRLSELAGSGIVMASELLKQRVSAVSYTYPGRISMPVPVQDIEDGLIVEVIDEQARFNINSIIFYGRQKDNEKAMATLRRLFRVSGLDERLVDYLADWIDADTEPRVSDSEIRAKNAPLYSVSELGYIKGFNSEIIENLRSKVTVYGDDYGKININTAEKHALMALSDEIDETLADRLILYRERSPFKNTIEVKDVPGFGNITGMDGKYTVKSNFFRIRVEASFRSIRRTAEAVVDLTSEPRYLFYKEM